MTTSNANNLVEMVRDGYGRGWSFTPLAGKRPTLPAWQSRPRESLEQALAWAAKGNVGIRTGANSNGLLVVDLDTYKPTYDQAAVDALGLVETVTVKTGRDGLQLYYKLPVGVSLGNTSEKLAPAVETKGDGGQVVFPGSRHPETGRAYEWVLPPWETELAELPANVLAILTGSHDRPKAAPAGRRASNADRAARYARTALELECRAVQTAPEGDRNNTLNKAAYSLGTLIGAGRLSRGEVEAALHAAAAAAKLGDVEARATIRSGLESGIANPRPMETAPEAARTAPSGTRATISADVDQQADQPAGDAPEARKEIVLVPGGHVTNAANYIEVNAASFTHEVITHFPADLIYAKDHVAGELLGQPGKRRWEGLTENRTRILIDSHIRLGKWIKNKATDEQFLAFVPASKDHAGLTMAATAHEPSIRDLRLMVNYPIYGPGFVRVAPGWSAGLYYDEPGDLVGLTPETDCEVIHNTLYDVVVDFPFKTDADRQNFFGLLLTPLVAPALDGNRPLHLINSPMERTGKGKLVNEVLGGVVAGRGEIPAMQITEYEDEREKRILAMLLQGESLMHLDNLPHFIDSAALASLLTTGTFAGRQLGMSKTLKLPNNLTIVGTGNNVEASSEVIKRCVPIMLEPTDSHPENRTAFQHADIRSYVRQHRRTILECLLGMIENWLIAGRPPGELPLGGFESWAAAIGGILKVNGMKAWRTNEADWRASADPHGAEMGKFVAAWRERWGEVGVTSSELLEIAADVEVFEQIRGKSTPAAIGSAFGKMLNRHVDRVVGDWRIRRDEGRKKPTYRLVPISPDCGKPVDKCQRSARGLPEVLEQPLAQRSLGDF